jgi:hypothetical protein
MTRIYVVTSKQVGDSITSGSLRMLTPRKLVCGKRSGGVAYEYEVIGPPA